MTVTVIAEPFGMRRRRVNPLWDPKDHITVCGVKDGAKIQVWCIRYNTLYVDCTFGAPIDGTIVLDKTNFGDSIHIEQILKGWNPQSIELTVDHERGQTVVFDLKRESRLTPKASR